MKKTIKIGLFGIGLILLLCIASVLVPSATMTGILVLGTTGCVFVFGWKKTLLLALAGITGILLAIGAFKVAAQVEYTRIDHLTDHYSAEMLPSIAQSANKRGKIGQMVYTITLDYIKVFEVKADTAKVFVATDMLFADSNGYTTNDRFNDFYFLKRQNEVWIIDPTRPVDGIWEAKGSSDRMTWPPYR